MSRLDEKTVIPIGWVIAGFMPVVCITVTGAFWIAAVDFRLGRIEEKLGIPAYHASTIISEAHASKKEKR